MPCLYLVYEFVLFINGMFYVWGRVLLLIQSNALHRINFYCIQMVVPYVSLIMIFFYILAADFFFLFD